MFLFYSDSQGNMEQIYFPVSSTGMEKPLIETLKCHELTIRYQLFVEQLTFNLKKTQRSDEVFYLGLSISA